jgi:hypothetical protein
LTEISRVRYSAAGVRRRKRRPPVGGRMSYRQGLNFADESLVCIVIINPNPSIYAKLPNLDHNYWSQSKYFLQNTRVVSYLENSYLDSTGLMASSSSPKSLSQCRPRSASTPRHSPPLPSRWELSKDVGRRCLSHCRVTSLGMKDARGAHDIDGVIQTLC